ncbi:hypothetical protein PILCRDRAFT_15619 [Piloderma croceum F 1598]|uniref:Uncharacterized protein n=1 Tax=Piloderma croceum (strain F 1598) TaxID=765440 RepID=A0A0C3EK61_PILCF|nr:hypothetical protein PILCRDRAFT_15619 [Piloderma croceum F 1598]
MQRAGLILIQITLGQSARAVGREAANPMPFEQKQHSYTIQSHVVTITSLINAQREKR